MWDIIFQEIVGEPSVSEKTSEILKGQAIDREQPGTILRDFTTLLEFIGDDGLKTGGKHCLLPQKCLGELNERMTNPVKHRLKRPQQRSFPHLNGLYMILRASGMGTVQGAPPKGHLTIDEEMVGQWLDMNPTEQYFTLLESWLIQSSAEMIGEEEGWVDSPFYRVFETWQQFRKRKTTIPKEQQIYLLRGTMRMVTVALLELFGWVKLGIQNPQEGEGVQFASLERLSLGDAMMDVVGRWMMSECGRRAKRARQSGQFQPLFQPYFPEWKRNLALSEVEFREGQHTWHVSLGKAWRRIVTPADTDLDELAMVILDAFNFDDDHLYCFELADRRGRSMRIACGYEEDAEHCTGDVQAGDVPLPVGGVMTFVFDYGDDWEFTVKLESVDTNKTRRKKPKIIARGGKAPAQYDWDDDWDDDDDE